MVGSLIGLYQGKTPPKQTRQTLNYLEENCCVRATGDGPHLRASSGDNLNGGNSWPCGLLEGEDIRKDEEGEDSISVH